MHVVIPVAEERVNPSLAHALASIVRHTTYRAVTIGHDHGNPLHITTRQGRDQFENTDVAMRVACETSWISDPFVWSADDIYWMRPAAPVRWAIGKLEDAQGQNAWQLRKRATAATLTDLGLPTWDYEAHVPMLVHKRPMLEALRIGGDKRSVYGNLTGVPDVVKPDVKVRQSADVPPVWEPWVSTRGNPARWPDLIAALT